MYERKFTKIEKSMLNKSIYPGRNSAAVTSLGSYHGLSFTFIREVQSPTQ